MVIRSHKSLIWIVLFWFVVLQSLAPFIHGHIETGSPQQGSGLHMHADEVMPDVQEHGPSLHAPGNILHTIEINKGIVKDSDGLLPAVLAVMLFALLSLFIAPGRLAASVSALPSPRLFLASSQPRAPPRS